MYAAKMEGVSCFLIAGDIIGYYYESNRIITALGSINWFGVTGNHEQMLFEMMEDIQPKNNYIKFGSSILDLPQQLCSNSISILNRLPTIRHIRIDKFDVLLSHGSPWNPNEYIYPDAKEKYLERLKTYFDKYDLLILGHTHYPMLWKDEKGTILNPGAVGQPRDYLSGACWALWDTVTNEISLRRESYNQERLLEMCKSKDPDNVYLSEVLTRRR